jgi:uncharacterized RDD family membrane protein YckC
MGGYDYRPQREDTDVVGARVGAAIIDSLVVFVVTFVFVFVAASLAIGSGAGGVEALVVLGAFVFVLAYYFLLEGLWEGQTVGKRALDIRVLKESGRPIGIGESVLRNLLRIVDGFFYYAVGFAFMATSDKRMRLGDRVAGTVVVRATPRRHGGRDPTGRDRREDRWNEPDRRGRDGRDGDARRTERDRRGGGQSGGDGGWNDRDRRERNRDDDGRY